MLVDLRTDNDVDRIGSYRQEHRVAPHKLQRPRTVGRRCAQSDVVIFDTYCPAEKWRQLSGNESRGAADVETDCVFQRDSAERLQNISDLFGLAGAGLAIT